jgi:ATP-dependent exoDNAse (exonuclease V) alpha subunit
MPVIDSKTEELLGWRKRTELDRKYDLIVIDEASMVGDEMIADLQAHGVPILAVGDHGQLPPVMSGGDLMAHPMLRLEKIHRQAEGNPIIRLAHAMRETGRFEGVGGANWWAEDGRVRFAPRANTNLIEGFFAQADNPLDVGVLCWTNKTRIRMNAFARRGLGRSGTPTKGEIVICLKNAPPVYNGMRGVLTTDATLDGWLLSADVAFPEEELPAAPMELCAGQFNREGTFRDLEELRDRGIVVPSMKQAGGMFDYGYAMTVHKSQGSQFDHAILYVDREADSSSIDWRRWAYTGLTRAINKLTILI